MRAGVAAGRPRHSFPVRIRGTTISACTPHRGAGHDPLGAEVNLIDDWGQLIELVSHHPGLYLRFSHGPDVDADEPCSHDYEAGQDMPGLWRPRSPEPWWTRPTEDWVARRLCKYADLGQDERYPWLARGELVGRGPDHEPLIRVIAPVARIGSAVVNHAAAHYEAHFDVGRSSR